MYTDEHLYESLTTCQPEKSTYKIAIKFLLFSLTFL